jgi:hypothetical protein
MNIIQGPSIVILDPTKIIQADINANAGNRYFLKQSAMSRK